MTNQQKRLLIILLIFPLLLLTVLQIHNVWQYPVTHGFDAVDHMAYINIIKHEHRFPLANEGGETDHPPLYYLIASLFPTINQVKIIGFISWLIITGVTFYFLNRLYNSVVLSLTSSLITTSLPAILYMTPQISNELLAAALISISLVYHVLEKRFERKYFLVQGILLGLCIFTKITGFILVAAIIIDLLLKNRKQINKVMIDIILLCGIILVVGGFFYVRNLIIFHNPFVMSTDFPEMYFFQPPGYRDVKFFTDLSGFITGDLFHAHHYSLWAGTYFSWFYDGHNVLIPVQEFSKAGIALIVLSIPLVIFFFHGYWIVGKERKYTLLLIYPLLLFLFYIYFMVKLPFYSSVKAVYLLSTVVPFSFFITYNLRKISFRNLLMFILYLNIYTLVIVKNFWILANWF